MLHPELTQINHSVPAVVGDTDITEEGMALVIDGALPNGGGITVKPSANATGQRFYGVSMFERRPPVKMPDVLEFTLPVTAGLTNNAVVATLPFTPDPAGTTGVAMYQNNIQIRTVDSTGDGGTNAGLVVDGKTIKVSTTDGTSRFMPISGSSYSAAVTGGATVKVQYSYTPTTVQKVALVGTNINLAPLHSGAQVTCIRKGIIYTTNYEVETPYHVGWQIGIGADGKFTRSGARTTDTNLETDIATVIHVPSPDTPFLGIELL